MGFNINGFELGLDPDATGVTPGNQSVAYWAVTDIAARVEQLLQAGATIIIHVQDVGGGIQTAVVADPFGNAIGLIEGA